MEEISLNLGKGPELTVINKNDTGAINLNSSTQKKSVNFGPGAEMLMNPKRESRSQSPKPDINISDLSELDSVNLNGSEPKKPRPSFSDVTTNIFEATKPSKKENIKLNIAEEKNNVRPLGTATNPTKIETDDGFKKFNEIPVAPTNPPPPVKLSKEQELREKLSYLRKLEALEKKGITLTKKYSMESSLDEMKGGLK